MTAAPTAGVEERELVARLVCADALLREAGEMIASFGTPDADHKALRSAYSPRGVCEVYPRGQHSGLCVEWGDILVRIALHFEPGSHGPATAARPEQRGEDVG